MTPLTRRGLGAVALSLACAGSWAQGASTIIGGLHALFAEQGLRARSAACSLRFPATAEPWTQAVQRIRRDQAPVFDELAQRATRFVGPDVPDTPARQVARDFLALAERAPTMQLSPMNDTDAAALCERWRVALEPAGLAEQSLPAVLEAARKLSPPT